MTTKPSRGKPANRARNSISSKGVIAIEKIDIQPSEDNAVRVIADNPLVLDVKVKRLSSEAILPERKTPGAGCFDICSAEERIIKPGEVAVIGTGFAFEIPEGYVMKIYPRSGISSKTMLRQPNSVAIIDSDYRGEVKLIFENTHRILNPRRPYDEHMLIYTVDGEGVRPERYGDNPLQHTYVIRKGDRLAQGEIVPVINTQFYEVDELSETERGEGGLGSTGV